MAAKDKAARTPGGRMITIEVNANGEALYDIQEIRKMRLTVDGDAEFLVKWRGYKKPTWEPLDNLDSSSPVMVAFMRKEAASGKAPRVYTPRKSTGPPTPRRAAAGSAKNTPTKPSTPTRPVRLQLKTIDTREREAALARARREQAEKEAEEDKGEKEKKEEKEEEKAENAPSEQIRVQKRPRLMDEEEEEVVTVQKKARNDEAEKKVEEKKRCSIM